MRIWRNVGGAIGIRFLLIAVSGALCVASVPAQAQNVRVTGIDISAWQGNLSQANFNTIHRPTDQQVSGIFGDGKDFIFIRSSRGGTTGYYDQNNSDNNPPNNTLSQRYDDPYFIQNMSRATTAGLFAGSYHFGRMDIIASTTNANGIANTGTDEADHFLQMAGPWMRPGYLLPIFDYEAGNGFRTASQLAQFAIDFSDRIFAVKGIRPGVYIGNNYANPINNIAESATVVAAYPTLWSARWPNQSNPNSIDIQGTDPGDYTSTVYGPWDNAPNPADPWHFWQYASTGHLNGIGNGSANVDLDVAKGGIEFIKDHLVPALWVKPTSGDWSGLTNWNSGETPVAPVQGPGQVARVGALILPTTRVAGAAGTAVTDGLNDTVILDRAGEDITVTLSSGSYNIRKLYAREALNITGGSLNINYVPSWDSTPISAQFSDAVTLGAGASLSVHTLQVDAAKQFTLSGGALALNTLNLMPGATPASLLINGNVSLNPLTDAAAAIANGTGSGISGFVDLGGATRELSIANGTAAVDLALNVPITNGGLTKKGLGTLALNSTNTYLGNTTVQAGTLRLGNSSSLADATNIYLLAGTTLDLNFSGTQEVVHGLAFDGIVQAEGIWGPVGSGAQFTSPFLTGTGRLNVTSIAPPPPPVGNVLDDFEIDEGHFGWVYNFSPVSQTYGLAATTTIDRVTTQHQGNSGTGSQLLNLVIDSTGDATWQIRHNSGIGANMAAQPGGNVPLDATGYVGFWLKTDDPGVVVRLGVDDPDANTALERGYAQNVISDNEWHLYQWNFEDDGHWDAFAGGANGTIDAVNGTVTIDSIWFTGAGSAQIYLDNVSHNPDGLLSANHILGDYNSDGVVNSADYDMWRDSYADSVTVGTKADGTGDGVVGIGDFLLWQMQVSAGSTAALGASGAPVPEPASALLAAVGAIVLLGLRRR